MEKFSSHNMLIDNPKVETAEELFAAVRVAENQFEAHAAGTHVLRLLDVSPSIDKLGTWALGSVGAISAILIAKIDTITNALTPEGYSCLVISLALSVFFGISAKYCATKSQMQMDIFTKSVFELSELSEEFEQRRQFFAERAQTLGSEVSLKFDQDRSTVLLLAAFPLWIRVCLKRRIDRAAKKKHPPLKEPVTSFVWQCSFTVLQLAAVLWFLVAVAYYAA